MVVYQFLTDFPLVLVRFGKGLIGLPTPILANGKVDADGRLGKLPGADLKSIGPSLDAQPALETTGLIQGQHERGLIINHPAVGHLQKAFKGCVQPQGLSHHLVMVARKDEIKGEITLLIGKAEESATKGEPRATVRQRLEQIMAEEKLDEKAALKRSARKSPVVSLMNLHE